jgi:hypothetical protein
LSQACFFWNTGHTVMKICSLEKQRSGFVFIFKLHKLCNNFIFYGCCTVRWCDASACVVAQDAAKEYLKRKISVVPNFGLVYSDVLVLGDFVLKHGCHYSLIMA